MTTISAKIIADSSAQGSRVTTMQLRYPRCIHAEFMTHRVFSRNASSSRAIPVKRLIQDVLGDPFIPCHWGKNQKGMQADEECHSLLKDMTTREDAWLSARDNAVAAAQSFNDAGYHKQLVNRLLEPFAHINVVVTSTQWSNFFALRDHPDAEPHIALLAQAMKQALSDSRPTELKHLDWHLPYVSEEEQSYLSVDGALAVSVARCARVSYMTHDGQVPNIKEDIDLAQKLLGSTPLHASPAEHQAQVNYTSKGLYCGNLGSGWVQHRKILKGECQ
jgi:thymidylate synthase ThyX